MPRPKKDAHVLNIKLESSVYEDLDRFCEETGVTKTAAVEKILRSFLDDYFRKPKEDRTLF
ncbi:hypothetical protein CXIVA_07850 [Clostridium sp. SY8519]|uniref:RepB family protein n=1 Tax=Clostridium sp. (strain SY8519) TaxID=1042156 RepID=UPI000217202D|nr:RepB family protein [Clostridium sp. SY8519]BAK46752.1 hypothetical protein CXIVA_07850 [Clostridium sp. SY8519]